MVLTATAVGARRTTHAPLLAGALLAAGCAAVAVVDPTDGPTICPFKAATGLDCPGCGGTRAAHALFRGDLLAAASYNVLALVAIPFILWGTFAWLTRAFGGRTIRTYAPSLPVTLVALGVLLSFWVVRNLSMAPFDWLYSGT
ncbi:MAG TPA: DUF2752 domain-containing protein [Acidimicrobiia bacterium]|nr:DUF2752 domain-containing protein [Acidimicrobiia bacterium]